MAFYTTLLIFLASAAATWIAGVWLTRTTDAIDTKYKLSGAFGGLLILGIVTSLPETAVVITASLEHHFEIVIGTLIGGIAIQTVVLAILDARMKLKDSLTYAAASLTLVLEAGLVILITAASIMAIRTPVLVGSTGISITALFVLIIWIAGVWIVYQARKGLPWHSGAIDNNPGRAHLERMQVINHPSLKKSSTFKIFALLIISSIVTLIAGYGLATSGYELARAIGMGTGLFAATFIALTGALPNISTGIASIDLGDYKLAMSDIFGGNAFMPALFFVACIISGEAVLRGATDVDIWFAALGIFLTTVYLVGLVLRPKKVLFKLGLDSLLVVLIYIIGVVALSLTGV